MSCFAIIIIPEYNSKLFKGGAVVDRIDDIRMNMNDRYNIYIQNIVIFKQEEGVYLYVLYFKNDQWFEDLCDSIRVVFRSFNFDTILRPDLDSIDYNIKNGIPIPLPGDILIFRFYNSLFRNVRSEMHTSMNRLINTLRQLT